MVLTAAINLGSRGGRGRGARALGEAGAQDGDRETNKIGGILESILKVLKPLLDLVGLIVALIAFTAMKLIKSAVEGIQGIITWVKNLWDISKKRFAEMVEWLKVLPGKIWEFLKALPGQIWEFIKNLGSIIWDFIKTGFGWLVEKLSALWETLKEFATTLMEHLSKAWEFLKEKIKLIWEKIKTLAKDIWERMKSVLEKVRDRMKDAWEAIKALPQQIWDKIKALAGMIAEKLKEVIRNLNPFRRREDVDDLIITKGRIFKTSPEDTIIATKSPGTMGGQKILNFYGLTWPEAMEQVKRELGVDSFNQGRF